MFLLRDAQPTDLPGLTELARILNTMNLPHDKAALEDVLDRAARSFSGAISEPREREYLFVAEDLATKRIVGTSLIIAQHGTKNAPHLYFEVIEDQRYSSTLDKHFHHTMLRLGRDFEGPTEIGGLILHPDFRGTARLGKQLSYVRFLFIAMHKRWFRRRLLAELLPPLLPDGTSLLWEHLGRHFTGLPYTEADHISRKNKEFIVSLFPAGEMYATLLPQEVQDVIGRVGPQTKGVERMLSDVGFEFSHRIDPFDGGPHFESEVANVSVIGETKKRKLAIGGGGDRFTHLVACEDKRTKFQALGCAADLSKPGEVAILEESIIALGASVGDEVFVMPLDPPPQEPQEEES